MRAVSACGHLMESDEPMTPEEAKALPLGLYRLHWMDGGSSLAAVGQCYDGTRWFAPTNWTCDIPAPADRKPGQWPTVSVATIDWGMVVRAERIDVDLRE